MALSFEEVWHVLIIATVLSMGCATVKKNIEARNTDAPSTTVQYLKGQMFTTSPYGTTPYGPPVAVVAKRTLNADKDEIVAHTWHAKEFHTALFRLRANTLSFDVSDEKKTFEGTVTFQSDDLLSGSVLYDIKMLEKSGTISGTGIWIGDTYRTNKLFSDPTGTPRARMTETLQTVTKEDFFLSLPK